VLPSLLLLGWDTLILLPATMITPVLQLVHLVAYYDHVSDIGVIREAYSPYDVCLSNTSHNTVRITGTLTVGLDALVIGMNGRLSIQIETEQTYDYKPYPPTTKER
jgi:hypothetical protein